MNQKYEIAKNKIEEINKSNVKMNIMEVCGTHTAAISKFGLRSVLGSNINLISGPGCPVCVTPNCYIDYAYELSMNKDIIITTYGDMIRVPGSTPHKTLEYARAMGSDIRMVYSSMDALKIAKDNKDKKIVFLAIGFETTVPHTAVAVKEAYENSIDNFYILSMHKLVEPVMRNVLEDKELNIDGFLCPGHVAAIIGAEGFEFLKEYKCSGVITGFEFEEIVDALYVLVKSIDKKESNLYNCYETLVKYHGNQYAKVVSNELFEVKDDYWRGMGIITKSGLRLKDKYKAHNIEEIYPLHIENENTNNGCQCGDVLKGKIKPYSCKLFGKICTPENPIGPCMVSTEGSCAAYYKYL